VPWSQEVPVGAGPGGGGTGHAVPSAARPATRLPSATRSRRAAASTSRWPSRRRASPFPSSSRASRSARSSRRRGAPSSRRRAGPVTGIRAASRRSAARTTERGATSAPPSARTRATAPRSAARSAPAPASSSALGPATTTRPSSRWSTSTSRCPQAIASTAAAERMGWTSAAGPGARPWCSPTMGDPPVRNPASSRDRGVARGRSTSADRPHRAVRPSSPRPAPRHGAPTAVSAGRTGWCRRR
jgi:hypothetical protein